MWPGSGPSDRDNDGYFRPIREHLLWRFGSMIIDYDPRPALARIEVPLLALFGSDDTRIPVDASVASYRANLPEEILSVEILNGGDHRLQSGDPLRLVPSYLETLTTFIERATGA
jgi:pimeloyl-ACP methyl ester carboxylesterase